jgi:hypothetical protein
MAAGGRELPILATVPTGGRPGDSEGMTLPVPPLYAPLPALAIQERSAATE